MKYIRLIFKNKALLNMTIACLKSLFFKKASISKYRSWIEWWIQLDDVSIAYFSVTAKVGSYFGCLFQKALHPLQLVEKTAGTRAIFKKSRIIIPVNHLINPIRWGRGFVVYNYYYKRKLNNVWFLKTKRSYTNNLYFGYYRIKANPQFEKYNNRLQVFRGLKEGEKRRGIYILLINLISLLVVNKKLIYQGNDIKEELNKGILMKTSLLSLNNLNNNFLLFIFLEILKSIFESILMSKKYLYFELKDILNYLNINNLNNGIWWVEISLEKLNNNLQDKILINQLARYIDDSKFLNLLNFFIKKKLIYSNKLLYLFLLDIYLLEFDNFCLNLSNKQIKYTYLRNKFNILISINSNKLIIKQIIKKIELYLKINLKFSLAKFNFKLSKEKVNFCDLEISNNSLNSKYLNLNIPLKKIINYLKIYGFCNQKGDPIPCTKWYKLSRYEINIKINKFLLNFYNFYKFTNNNNKTIRRIDFILRNSVAKLFAAKYKLKTRAKVFKTFGKGLNLKTNKNLPYFGLKNFAELDKNALNLNKKNNLNDCFFYLN